MHKYRSFACSLSCLHWQSSYYVRRPSQQLADSHAFEPSHFDLDCGTSALGSSSFGWIVLPTILALPCSLRIFVGHWYAHPGWRPRVGMRKGHAIIGCTGILGNLACRQQYVFRAMAIADAVHSHNFGSSSFHRSSRSSPRISMGCCSTSTGGTMSDYLIVNGLLHLHPLEPSQIHEFGIFLSGLQPEPWTEGWKVLGTGWWKVNLSALFSQTSISMFLSYGFLTMFCDAFYAAGFEDIQKPEEGKTDLTREIRTLGRINVATSMLFGVPVSHSFKVAVVMDDAGGKTKLWVLLLGLTYLFFYFESSARSMLVVVPKCAFGGLVVSLGAEFLISSILQSRERVATDESRFVVLTGITVYFNVLLGISLGICLTTVFFVVEYSGLTGIINKATLKDVRSLVERSDQQCTVLDTYGQEVVIFWCSGYIFFGTAALIIEELELWLDGNPTTHLIILDFEQVPAVDASGVQALTKFAACCESRRPPVIVSFTGLVRRLRLALDRSVKSNGVQSVKLSNKRVEQTLEWAEEQLLKGRVPRALKPDIAKTGMQVGRAALAAKLAQKVSEASVSHDAKLMGVLEELLSEIASGAGADERNKACQMLLQAGVQISTFTNKEYLYMEGDNALDLVYIVDGSVDLCKKLSPDEDILYKMPRHHLNEEKGDIFVFEQEANIRVARVSYGAVLGAIEFGLACASTAPTRLSSAMAAPSCLVLRVQYEALQSALRSSSVVGHAVMTWLSELTSMHVLELLKASRIKPFRRVDHDSVKPSVIIPGELEHLETTTPVAATPK
eukprot:TRINITY_DN72685_c0_g1_i1.p1 TRINITY_DN72685_c0_g1~~TRINITY_DN72685_c0_g1_i1.p1  ORF type:complete len:787 (-),score=103.38 TRINITY_DN72685_c0_g1_i1:281-2641(-)